MSGSVRLCRTCGYPLTNREREDYVDQCAPCVYAEVTP